MIFTLYSIKHCISLKVPLISIDQKMQWMCIQYQSFYQLFSNWYMNETFIICAFAKTIHFLDSYNLHELN